MTLLELLSISLADKASSARRSERSDRFIAVSDAACRPCQAEKRAIAKLAFAIHAARMDTGRCGENRIYAYLRQARPRVGVSTQHKRRTTGPPAPTRGRAWARSYLLSRKLNSGRPCVKDASELVTEEQAAGQSTGDQGGKGVSACVTCVDTRSLSVFSIMRNRSLVATIVIFDFPSLGAYKR